jgi:hypothetical protein
VARRVARRKRFQSLDERRALLLREAELAALAQHPAWEVFRAMLAAEETIVRTRVASQAMSPTGITLEEQAYNRGVLRGLERALAIPELAEGAQDKREAEGEEVNV